MLFVGIVTALVKPPGGYMERVSVAIVVLAQSHLLRLCVGSVAFPGALRSALRPFPETSGADPVLLTEGTHHANRTLEIFVRRSGRGRGFCVSFN